MIDIVLTCLFLLFFFFNDTATTEIYTLSLHDALPISQQCTQRSRSGSSSPSRRCRPRDRKSTRLNSSHVSISYAVFCLKKKNKHAGHTYRNAQKNHISNCTTKETHN